MKLGVVGRCVLGWSGVAGAESAGSQPAAVVAKTFPIGDTVPGPNFEMELLNSATVGADSYLVAWDTTLQKSGLPRKHSATVTRIAKDGTLLDPRGIPFPRSKLVPDDAWYYWMLTGFDGANYRVGMQRENDTIFARLAPDGHFLDATDEQLLVVPGAKGLACTTDGACVTIHDEVVENGNRVSFIRLTKDNALVDPAGQEPNVLVPVNGDCYYNQPFSAGNEIGLLMKCSRYIANGKYDYQHWLTFFDPASATFSTPVLAADLGASDATVYAAGRSGEAMLAWGVVKVGVSLTCAQKVQRFSTAGKKLDLKPRQLQTTECSAGIATAGDQYVLATYNPNAPFQTTGHFLQSDGQEVPGIAVPLGRNHADFSIVADGQTVLAAQGAVLGDGSSRSDFNDEQLYISLFENSGELVKPAFPIAATPNLMSSPAVAWGGDSYLAIWSDTRNGPAPDVYGARISSTGAVLDNPPLPLIHDDAATVGTALASNGNGYLLVDKAQTNPTEIENRTMAVRVTPIDKNGKPGKQQKLFDGSGTPDGDIDARYNPRVIWDGKHYVLGWWGFGYYNDNKLNVMRLNADGTALDAGPVDLAVPGGMPVLATTPDGFLAVWVNQDGIYTAALADGPDKLEVSSDPTRISFYIGTTPSAACSPTVCAVVWAYGSGPSFDMELQLVDLKGHAIGQTRDFPLSLAEPLVTWNGLAFVVTSASGNNFVEYFGEDGAPVANTQMSLTPANTLWEVAAASDGAGHSLFVTGMFDDARLTGVMLGQQTEGDAGAGGAGGASDVGSGGTSVGGTNVGGASTAGTGGTGIASNGGSGGTEMVSAENGGEISTTGGAGIDNGAGTAGSPVQVEPTSDTQPQDGSGCGCRLTPTQSSSTPFALLAALALLAQRRRRGARLGHHPVG